ncbi:hypothetical protein ACHAWF_011257 [Thalassiosira exigua]
MVFIDISFLTAKNIDTKTTTKVSANEDDLMLETVKKAIRKLLEKETPGGAISPDAVDSAVKRIKSISCDAADKGSPNLLEFLFNSGGTWDALNSIQTPIFKLGLYIELPKEDATNDGLLGGTGEPPAKKAKVNGVDVLMGKVLLDLSYLEYEGDLDKKQEIDQVILEKLYALFREIGLGYRDDKQRNRLKTNSQTIKNALCFVTKHWGSLLRAEFPHIPTGKDGFASSKLLQSLVDTEKRAKKSAQLSREDLAKHINFLSRMMWNDFAVPALKPVVAGIKDEVKFLCNLLQRHQSHLTGKANQMMKLRLDPSAKKKSRGIITSFKNRLNVVEVAVDEFHACIDSAFRPSRPRGLKGKFAICVKAAVDNVFSILRGKEDYQPFFLTDEAMGIEKFAAADGNSFLTPLNRAKFRSQFRNELVYGIECMKVHVFGKLNSGTDPDCLFLWKVPVSEGADHVGRVARAIHECKDMAPKKMCTEAARHFNAIMEEISHIPAGARDALRNYLFLGDPNPNKDIADEYVDFVLSMAAGRSVDESVFVDDRATNSRAGRGIGSTQYTHFWTACKEILLPEARAEERRNSDTMYASRAHSIPNLVKQATEVLKNKVNSGVLSEMPPIPCMEWVRLQFVPNCAYNTAAFKFTGMLEIRRAVQARTLRKEHPDQHWVNALTRYYLEWVIELKHKHGYDGVEFFGQDDKAKILIGDKVPVSTGVRANNTGIVSVNDESGLKALDHDFHVGNMIAAATLRGNIPEDMSGSFFIGDEERGTGQIFVTLRCAIFNPSEIFDHCAQLIDAICSKSLTPSVLVLQTDGGPDHSMKRIAVKLALVAMFKELNLDRLVALRGAPNGSAGNIVERSMSVLNLPLAHVSLARAQMSDYAEEAVKNCSSMKSVRDMANQFKKQQQQARLSIPQLEKELDLAIAAELLAKFVDTMFSEVELEDEALKNRAWGAIQLFAGIDCQSGDEIAGAMATRQGKVSTFRRGPLKSSILRHKLAKANRVASRSLEDKWVKAVGVPIKEIAQRFSRLTTSGRPVVVRPHVSVEKVDALYSQLKKIQPEYTPETICKREHLSTAPKLVDFLGSHVVDTPYCFDVSKIRGCSCCGELTTPSQFQDLALQKQPLPVEDPMRKGHYYRRGDALKLFSDQPAALTNLSHLPSHMEDQKRKDLKKRDIDIAKDLKLRSYESKKVRAIVKCFHCGKRRCIYSPSDEVYTVAITALQQKLESVSNRYSCGDLLFNDGHHLSRVLVQKQNMTCETQIERGYYNNVGRTMKLKPICIHCGELSSDPSFLLGQKELEERCFTCRYTCFPICVLCLDNGKSVVTTGKKNELK